MLSVPTGTQCVEHMDRKKPAWDPEEGAGKPKKGKSPAKPRKNSEARRLVQHFLFDFSITPVRLRDSGDATRSRGPDKFPRVWMRSIRGCGKVVKKNSYSDHKILWSACRKRLSVVVTVKTSPTYNRAAFSHRVCRCPASAWKNFPAPTCVKFPRDGCICSCAMGVQSAKHVRESVLRRPRETQDNRPV